LQDRYSWVLDGRFKGGYITRRFGDPANGVHAVQLEMTQAIYMDESAPFSLRPDLCGEISALLRNCVQAAADWSRTGSPPL
jgi:N-formylglutamate deformylase